MKINIKLAAIILFAIFLVSCGAQAENGGGEEVGAGGGVTMRAVIRAINEKIEVDVLESEYTSGVHWVLTNNSTVFLNPDGELLSREDLCVGDTVRILYSGQIMLSYPPQIVALEITVE